jgi:hypothetical protein
MFRLCVLFVTEIISLSWEILYFRIQKFGAQFFSRLLNTFNLNFFNMLNGTVIFRKIPEQNNCH